VSATRRIIKTKGYNDGTHEITVTIRGLDEGSAAVVKERMERAVIDAKRVLRRNGKRCEYKITLD
jgi:hypothetical protein